jgi:hypothetical protein
MEKKFGQGLPNGTKILESLWIRIALKLARLEFFHELGHLPLFHGIVMPVMVKLLVCNAARRSRLTRL